MSKKPNVKTYTLKKLEKKLAVKSEAISKKLPEELKNKQVKVKFIQHDEYPSLKAFVVFNSIKEKDYIVKQYSKFY
jgi:hypothetical protein